MAHNSVSQSMLCRPLNPSFRIGYSTGVKGALWRSASRQWERWWSIQNCEKISGSFFSPSENSSSTQAVHVLNVDTAASCSHSSAGTCPKVAARGRDSIHDTGSRCVLWTRSVQRQNWRTYTSSHHIIRSCHERGTLFTAERHGNLIIDSLHSGRLCSFHAFPTCRSLMLSLRQIVKQCQPHPRFS